MTWLRRTKVTAASAALCVFCALFAVTAHAATSHPVAHPSTHATPPRGSAKLKAVPATTATKRGATKAPSNLAKRHGKDIATPVDKPAAKKGTAVKGRRVDVTDDAPAAKGTLTKKKGSAAKTRPGAKPNAKSTDAPARNGRSTSKHGRQQRNDDADIDPPVVSRAKTARPVAKAPLQQTARVVPEDRPEPISTEIGSAFPDGEIKGHHERRPGPAATAARHGVTDGAGATTTGSAMNRSSDNAREPATSQDFLRAAGIARVDPPATGRAEVYAQGESHPDDDVRVDMSVPARRLPATTAIVTAVPPTLDRQRVKKTTKVSILPDDLAGKDAVMEEAATPMVLPNLYVNGRLVVPPPMKGTHEILVHQNTMADSDGLSRIQDDEDLDRMRASHLLVPVRESDALEVNSDLPANRRYARPWTERFVQDTARAYYARFHQSLRLNSAVRTVTYQLRLQRVNGNAAAVDGEDASPHLTGQAIDFGKRGMTMAQIAWMRAYLGPIMDAGKIDVEEEFQQACFHISVYKAYMPAPARKPRVMEVAQVRQAPIVRRAPKAANADDADIESQQ